MGNFRFKQFTVNQERSPMKVGTDGVLLGAWMSIDERMHRMLDIGGGTGLISLMAAQRAEACRLSDYDITAVEIDPGSAEDATENFSASPWSPHLHCLNRSLQDYLKENTGPFDLIFSNPPFFNQALTAPDPGRTDARHTTRLTHAEIIAAASGLLADGGILSLVLPTQEAREFTLAALTLPHFQRYRQCRIHTREGRGPKRYLLEFIKNAGYLVDGENRDLYLYEKERYSDEYLSLTFDFYL